MPRRATPGEIRKFHELHDRHVGRTSLRAHVIELLSKYDVGDHIVFEPIDHEGWSGYSFRNELYEVARLRGMIARIQAGVVYLEKRP